MSKKKTGKKLIGVILVLAITLGTLPINAAADAGNGQMFSDVKAGHWAKNSIDFVAQAGYMHGYGERFGVGDKITQGQFVAVLCRMMGIDRAEPDNAESVALELGLLKENEEFSSGDNLSRGDMARYVIRTFEALNKDAVYPDYLSAYYGMVSDYELLDEDLKTDVLKCIEKGLMTGITDGLFDPSGDSTRAQAAAVIHRILSQEERDKCKPVFAEPDPEFEAFLNTPYDKYLTVRNAKPLDRPIGTVKDGKIIFDFDYWDEVEPALLPIYHNSESNKIVYELIRNLTMYAKEHGHHVTVGLSSNLSNLCIWYYENEFLGKRNYLSFGTSFSVSIIFKPCYNYGFKYDERQKEDTYYEWSVTLLTKDTTQDWEAVNFKEPDMTKALEIAFESVYGEQLGQKVFNYAIGEYDKDIRAGVLFDKEYDNKKIGYYPELDGLEVVNGNGEVGTSMVFFCTNKK